MKYYILMVVREYKAWSGLYVREHVEYSGIKHKTHKEVLQELAQARKHAGILSAYIKEVER